MSRETVGEAAATAWFLIGQISHFPVSTLPGHRFTPPGSYPVLPQLGWPLHLEEEEGE